MNAADLKKLTTDSIDRLAELLDAGQSAQFAAFLKAMARFHRYSFHNVCLIASQRPTTWNAIDTRRSMRAASRPAYPRSWRRTDAGITPETGGAIES